jgi:hypothetical protein
MNHESCVNCGHGLRLEDVYCSKCSQKAATHKLTFGHLLHELFHAITHADKGLLLLVKKLAFHPGQVAREYADGKRKSYFSPFNFVLLCLSILVFMNSVMHVAESIAQPNPAILKQLPTHAARENYLNLLERTATATDFMMHKANLVYLIAIPFYALIMSAFFRRRTYAEHLVANIYFNGFLALATSLLVRPLLSLFHINSNGLAIMPLLLLIQILYMSWGYYEFLDYKRKRDFGKVILSSTLVLLLWTLTSAAGFFAYVYRSNAGQVVNGLAKHYLQAKK